MSQSSSSKNKRYDTRPRQCHSGMSSSNQDGMQSTHNRRSSSKTKRKRSTRAPKSAQTSSTPYDTHKSANSRNDCAFSTGGYSSRNTKQRENNSTRQPQRTSSTHQPQSTSSTGDELDIPGFYFDKEKKRYFKIAPNHSINSVTRDSITKKEAEIQRQKDEKQLLGPSRDTEKKKERRNIAILLRDRTCLNQHLHHLKASLLLCNITQLRPFSSQRIFKVGEELNCNLEHMQKMYIGTKHDEVLGLWSLRDTWVQRIQLLQISEKTRTGIDSSISVSAKPHLKVIIQSLNKVTDLCWAPMPGFQDKQTILYTTICHTGYLYSLAMIRSLNSDNEEATPAFLDYNLGKKATWTCAWNYHRQQFSVGSEKSALMLNIERRMMWDYNTNNSDPLSQTFSHQTGNYFHTGTRKGQILSFDLRSRSSYPITTLVHKSSVGSLALLQDDVSLVASDYSGRVCLWDLRKRATVVEYTGNVNQYTKLPVHVDETEQYVYTVGEDGYTRFWNLKQGTLLHTIPPPCAVSRETIPSVQYSMRWGDREGNAGLIMGLHNKLHFYGTLPLG